MVLVADSVVKRVVVVGASIVLLIICSSSGLFSSLSKSSTLSSLLKTEDPFIYSHTKEVDVEHTVSESSSSSYPHIIFILADDLGWNSIGYEDFDLTFASPYLTEYASKGLILSNYYAQEMCSPSRASLLTGRYPLSIGMQWGMVELAKMWGMSVGETTLAEVLKDEGYKTHLVGKWDLGHYSPCLLPTARGFNTYTGYLNGENYYYSKRYPGDITWVDFLTADVECYYTYDNDNMHNYSTHFYQDKAVEIISSHDVDDPLFLLVSFQAVHDPFADINGMEIPSSFVDVDIYKEVMSSVNVR